MYSSLVVLLIIMCLCWLDCDEHEMFCCFRKEKNVLFFRILRWICFAQTSEVPADKTYYVQIGNPQ